MSLFSFLGQTTAQSLSGSRAQVRVPTGSSVSLELFRRGHLQHARDESVRGDAPLDFYVRAMLAVREGAYESALGLAEDALSKAVSPEEASMLAEVKGRAMWYSGDVVGAEKVLRDALSSRPQAHEVRLALGEMLLGRGAKAEGELVLDAFSGFYNNGLLKTSVELSILARAMAMLGSYQDAHRALGEAVEADPTNVTAMVQWGDLLLSKYNVGDAAETYQEALNLEPNHPDALVGMARLAMENSNDFNRIQNLLDNAQLVEPKHVGMWVTRGQLAIYDADYGRARQAAEAALAVRKGYLPALTVLAACDFLENRLDAFEARLAEILAIHPTYADALVEVAEYGVRVFRYHEAVALDRRALKLVPGHAGALLSLGVGLTRTGAEDEGFDVLREAFDADPYNVRAFNMVELYEKVMPNYEFTDYGQFKLRALGHESDAVNAIVAPVVKAALGLYEGKYKHKTDPYLAVEIYPSGETFAVRSVGLPSVSPHGICFGPVVVSRSPSEGNFNWKQVIWHELAHVYHIQVSNHRVPRWFTEGLAEYETNIYDRGWQRHHDRELARALFSGTLRGVMDLDEGFTQARTGEEILRSYHQASLVVHYLAETHGFEKLVGMLRAWGQNKTAEQVYRDVLGVEASQIDAGFKTWLSRRYLNFHGQLAVDLAGIEGVREVQTEVNQAPDDGFARARLAVAKFRDGDVAGGNSALEEALGLGGNDPRVRYVAMLVAFEQGRMKDAYEHGGAVLAMIRDGYDVRMVLGAAAMSLEKLDEAELHYVTATRLWADGIEAWAALSRIAGVRKDEKLREQALSRMFDLDQHDPLVARQWWEWNTQNGRHKVARGAADRWLQVAPFDTRAQYASAATSLALGDEAGADAAYAMALTVRPSDTRDVVLEALRQGKAAGREGFVARWKKRAVEEKVPSRLVDRALE